MAQDFYAAFAVGKDDRGINSVDEEGVALAAIQGLYRQNSNSSSTTRRYSGRTARSMRA